MNVLLYIITFFIGVIGAGLNTLPPSATNLAVVKYTSDKTLSKALQLAYGAGLGEVLIAGLALSFGVLVKRLYEENTWIQIVFIILMAGAGIYFLWKKDDESSDTPSSKKKRFINGLLLGGLNLPMFIYWTAIYALSIEYMVLDENPSWFLILFFLAGVFLGKFSVLYLYGKLSDYMTDNFSKFEGKLNRVIGIVLCIAAVGQTINLFIK